MGPPIQPTETDMSDYQEKLAAARKRCEDAEKDYQLAVKMAEMAQAIARSAEIARDRAEDAYDAIEGEA